MNLSSLLAPERVACCPEIGSKKRVMEFLSERLASGLDDDAGSEIFDSLLARERLGSTGLGHGVAIPHGRMADLDGPVAAFARLERGIDYDAPDRQPVDLIFALIVPREATEEHLRILSTLARLFSDHDMVARLRAAEGSDALFAVLRKWADEKTTLSAA